MIRKENEYQKQLIHNMLGGKGDFKLEHILSSQELCGKGRLFARAKLEPGSSVGEHTHRNDFEICYFISGEGTVIDNGVKFDVKAGDCNVVFDGHTHEIINTGQQDLEYIAVIIYTDKM